MGGQVFGNQLTVSEFLHVAAAVCEHDLVVLLIDFRIPDDTEERREAGAGGDQVEIPAGQQVVLHQRARRLAVDQQLVPHLDGLQF